MAEADYEMKAFFIIVLLAAVAGGGYYFFVHQGKSINDLLGQEPPSLAPAMEPVTKAGPDTEKAKLPDKKPVAAKPAASKKPDAPKKSKVDEFVEKRYPMPDILPLTQITNNWSAVPARAFPKQVLASEEVPFTLMINGQPAGSTKVPAGTPLKPISLQGDQLTVASLANDSMRTQLHVDKTNFKQSIEKRYNDFVTTKRNEVAELRARAKKALQAQPERLAALENPGAATGGNKGDDPRLAAVKASIRRGEAPPTSIEEAQTYMWNGSEKIGGEMAGTYDTVSVHFEVATIFGRFPTDYKCLLRNGKVVGWIDPITEEKITK